MVAEAFIPNLEGKREVNHRDGYKLNNFLFNLEWSTPSENRHHAYKKGLIGLGENHPRHLGVYITPAGIFPTARAAAEAEGCSVSHMYKKCKPKNGESVEGYGFQPKNIASARRAAAKENK